MPSTEKPLLICLLGPTAAGKTPMAIDIVQRFPCAIISVDSAMVYRDMDIGTAKPSVELLKIAPHKLINICDPAERYSAGQFRRDALHEITAIHAAQRIPLLVGGTMLYFRVLQQGLAALPPANMELRTELQQRAQQIGWEGLHAELARVDVNAAERIRPQDSQRIQRALEVFYLTGRSISAWQQEATSPLNDYRIINIALAPAERSVLHERIALRFQQMLDEGFVSEVERLFKRGDLSPELPSIRSVGYRQVWNYLAGQCKYADMQAQAIAATRQLAKRQMTWLRSWKNIIWIDSAGVGARERVFEMVKLA